MISPMNYILRTYGSKRGLLRHCKYSAQRLLLAKFSNHRKLPQSIDRVVFVCKGNICRSPLAEEVFRHNCAVETTSLGLDTQTGRPAHPPVVRASMLQGYDLSNHTTTCVEAFSAQTNDLYVCTEPQHAQQLEVLFKTQNVLLLGLFGEPKRVYIHDPYSASYEYTGKTVNYLIKATQNLAAAISASDLLIEPSANLSKP